jgi:hypothetical protein
MALQQRIGLFEQRQDLVFICLSHSVLLFLSAGSPTFSLAVRS